VAPRQLAAARVKAERHLDLGDVHVRHSARDAAHHEVVGAVELVELGAGLLVGGAAPPAPPEVVLLDVQLVLQGRASSVVVNVHFLQHKLRVRSDVTSIN